MAKSAPAPAHAPGDRSGATRRASPPAAGIGAERARRALSEATDAGLLDGETEHFSFRAPKALIAAARREAGIASTTELGRAALAMLAQGDAFAEFFARTEGALGPDFTLDY